MLYCDNHLEGIKLVKKKTWSGVASGVMLLSLLAGCGGNNAAGHTAGGSAAPGATASGDTKVNLRFYTYGTDDAYNWKNTFAAYEEKNPGVTIELVQLSENGDTQESIKKLDLEAASSAQMDILMFSDAASYAQRVALGMVEPLDDYIARDGGYKEEEDYKVATRLNGKVYSLPGKFNPWYVLLNKDHLDEAGLAVPTNWTWDDFREYARKLTKGEGTNKRYGAYFHGPQGGGWMEFLKLKMENQPKNTEFLKSDGSSNLDDPNFRATLELRQQMEIVDKSTVPYTEIISKKLAYRPLFFNQQVSMILIASWMNNELGGTDKMPLNFHLAVAPFPKNNAGDPDGLSPVATDYVAVAAKSKHKEEAYHFIRWYTTEGQFIQGKNIPAWNGVSSDQVGSMIDKILAGTKSPKLVDRKSLVNTIVNSKASGFVPPFSYQSEVYRVINAEYEKLILNDQDVDTTVKNAKEAVQKVIDANK